MPTPAADVVVAAWRALDRDEQDHAFEQISALRLQAQAGADSEAEQYVRALRIVAEHVACSPSPDDYKAVREALRKDDVELPPIGRIIKHFDTWRLAKEALELSETTTVRRIEARFRFRRLGKVWRYSDQTLAETMADCVKELGRPPRVAEFDWWRERQLQLAKARGDDALHLPSPGPYRKRYKTWDGALLALGYKPDWIAARFEDGTAQAARRDAS